MKIIGKILIVGVLFVMGGSTQAKPPQDDCIPRGNLCGNSLPPGHPHLALSCCQPAQYQCIPLGGTYRCRNANGLSTVEDTANIADVGTAGCQQAGQVCHGSSKKSDCCVGLYCHIFGSNSTGTCRNGE